MPAKISFVTKPSKNIAFVFFLFDGDDVTKHPFFSFLEKEEQLYISKIKSTLKPKQKEIKVVTTPSATPRKIIVVGMGKMAESTHWKAGLATRSAVQKARSEKLERISFWVMPFRTPEETQNFYEVVASNAIMANFEFTKYKATPPEGFAFIKEFENVAAKLDKNIQEGLRRGVVIGEEINACRDLANSPGGDMTPQALADHAVTVARKNGIKATVLDVKKMTALGMGGVLGVGQGSDVPPRFIILEYMNGPKNEKPVVLVGKGVTFDSGGLNLKPSNHIYEMHMDMSGGAAMIHTIAAAARLKIKKNIVVLVPAVENMVSGRSYRPGDVLRTMNGITIEVQNTDAEGRVILSDALEYAKRYNPSVVIDAATLTGAAVVALGERYSALFTTNAALEGLLRTTGQEVGDPVWPLPLTAEYEDDIKSTFGDWSNAGRPGTGGAINGAVFLWQFIKGYRWAHIDIAPRMTSIDGEYLAKGAAGAPVRLLVRFLQGKML